MGDLIGMGISGNGVQKTLLKITEDLILVLIFQPGGHKFYLNRKTRTVHSFAATTRGYRHRVVLLVDPNITAVRIK